MERIHDVVLFDGTFRVVMTPEKRVIAVLNAPETLLGPLHIMLEVDRRPFLETGLDPIILVDPSYATAGLFSSIGKAIGKAAQGTFNAVSKVATTTARPAFNLVKGAASQSANLIANATPFLPASAKNQLEKAATIVARARLGDVNAKQFIRGVATAAKAGQSAAKGVANTLADASKLVANTIDVPMLIAKQIPGAAGIVRTLSPLERYQQMTTAVQRGDLKAVQRMLKEDISKAQGVISLVPGIGTGISAALSAGMAVLEGGSALEIAIKTAYGAIPIPIGIRQITDLVLSTALSFVAHPNDFTEVAVQVARDKIPRGLARDVFDTLIQLIVKKVPIKKVGASLAQHYVSQYAPAIGGQSVEQALRGINASQSVIQNQLRQVVQPYQRMVQPLYLAQNLARI